MAPWVRLLPPLVMTDAEADELVARLLAERLARNWGQSVIVDNRPGGQNVIGALAFVVGGYLAVARTDPKPQLASITE